MPISFPQPPQHVAEASADLTEGVAPVMPAQPVFTVGLEELVEAGGGEAQESVAAQPTWRAVRTGADGEPEVLEIAEDAEDAEEGAVAAGDDRFGPAIREALELAERDPRAREADFEARLFRVPALNLLALWLHAGSATDLFVPVGAVGPGLEAGRVYDDGEFMAAVLAEAQRLRSAYGEAEDPGELGS